MTAEPIAYLSDVLASGQTAARRWGARHLSAVLAGFRREHLEVATRCDSAWRQPLYAEWFARGGFLENVGSDGRGGPLTFAQKVVAAPLAPLLQAAFVEWRYYAILTKGFHGILGAAIFNPGNQLSNLAEGGLLCIVAGTLGGGTEHVCWQHLFPMNRVRYGGAGLNTMEASHGGCTLRIDQRAVNDAFVSLSGPNAPTMEFEHTGLRESALFPFLVEDLKRVPGAHWIVHNPSPVAHVKGSIRIPVGVVRSTGLRDEQGYPDFSSPGLHARAKAAGCHATVAHRDAAHAIAWEDAIDGSGYYEHSFGVNPLPLHGWDFMFAPEFERGQGLVMQTYKNSRDMRFIEVIWTEDGQRKYTRFGEGDFMMTWSRKKWHPHIRADIPMHRTIRGERGCYVLEIDNAIDEQLPFLRRRKLLVRHFFISEEIGRTRWVLRDASGRVVARSGEGGALSGGEVAYPRLYTPG